MPLFSLLPHQLHSTLFSFPSITCDGKAVWPPFVVELDTDIGLRSSKSTDGDNVEVVGHYHTPDAKADDVNTVDDSNIEYGEDVWVKVAAILAGLVDNKASLGGHARDHFLGLTSTHSSKSWFSF